MDRKTNTAAELALLLALSTLWGASYTFIKIGVETIPPITLIAARTLIAGAVLVAILRLRGLKLPTDRQVWERFLSHALCLTVFRPHGVMASRFLNLTNS